MKVNVKAELSLALAMFWLAGSAVAQDLPSLEVVVSGAVPDQGQVFVSVFDSPETFLKAPVIELSGPVNGEGTAVFAVGKLDRGSYSVSAIYDRDSNGEMNTGLFGIPTEPVGFSNNARGELRTAWF